MAPSLVGGGVVATEDMCTCLGGVFFSDGVRKLENEEEWGSELYIARKTVAQN